MNRLFKTLLVAVAGIVLLVVVSAAALMLLFDPNDFRERISAEVEKATGRELVIEGDLSVSLFPWFAVEVGSTRLGNASGFGNTPFASVESARLSVRLLPLLLSREITVGTAELESLRLELAVKANGATNWDDLTSTDNASTDSAEARGDSSSRLDISSIQISNSYVHYSDLQGGSDYTLQNLSLVTGRIAAGVAFDFTSDFDFELRPNAIDGRARAAGRINLAEDFDSAAISDFAIEGDANGIADEPVGFRLVADNMQVDLADSLLAPTEMTFSALGVDVDASVKSLSWADDIVGVAALQVKAFSPRDIATQLDIEMPETADPGALGEAAFKADATWQNDKVILKSLELQLDDSSFSGEMTVPMSDTGTLTFELQGNSMNLDRYMAPAAEGGAGAGSGDDSDFEIPVELIRSTDARGTLRLAEAQFSGMEFTNIQLGLNAANGRLRLNPISAELFDGNYTGDVQINAAGVTPSLSMNERVADVNLSPLGRAMFERDELSGTINGSFVLQATGSTLNTMRQNLSGNISFELADGAWEGVDLWYQLRAARALYRREEAPEARKPARTEFSSVQASGPVKDGVFINDTLSAEMPFLQVSGTGKVNFVTTELDYSLRARVLERPEFLKEASEEELAEFTEALIPVRVTGTLVDPTVRPDIEAMFRDEVDGAIKKKGDELKKRLLDKLVPTTPAAEAPADGEPAAEEEDPEDKLKERLKKLFD